MGRKPVLVAIDLILTGQRIRSVISESRYSVKEIQEILNLSCPQPVYRWMHGYVLPSVDNLYMLSRLFDVHMEDLLVGKAQADESERNVGE